MRAYAPDYESNPMMSLLQGYGGVRGIINADQEAEDNHALAQLRIDEARQKAQAEAARVAFSSWYASSLGKDGKFDMDLGAKSALSNPYMNEMIASHIPGVPAGAKVTSVVPVSDDGNTLALHYTDPADGKEKVVNTGDRPTDHIITIDKRNLPTMAMGIGAAYAPEMFKAATEDMKSKDAENAWVDSMYAYSKKLQGEARDQNASAGKLQGQPAGAIPLPTLGLNAGVVQAPQRKPVAPVDFTDVAVPSAAPAAPPAAKQQGTEGLGLLSGLPDWLRPTGMAALGGAPGKPRENDFTVRIVDPTLTAETAKDRPVAATPAARGDEPPSDPVKAAVAATHAAQVATSNADPAEVAARKPPPYPDTHTVPPPVEGKPSGVAQVNSLAAVNAKAIDVPAAKEAGMSDADLKTFLRSVARAQLGKEGAMAVIDKMFGPDKAAKAIDMGDKTVIIGDSGKVIAQFAKGHDPDKVAEIQAAFARQQYHEQQAWARLAARSGLDISKAKEQLNKDAGALATTASEMFDKKYGQDWRAAAQVAVRSTLFKWGLDPAKPEVQAAVLQAMRDAKADADSHNHFWNVGPWATPKAGDLTDLSPYLHARLTALSGQPSGGDQREAWSAQVAEPLKRAYEDASKGGGRMPDMDEVFSGVGQATMQGVPAEVAAAYAARILRTHPERLIVDPTTRGMITSDQIGAGIVSAYRASKGVK